MQAKNDVIYTQDDDCLIKNIDELISNYNDDLIVANCNRGRKKFYKKISGGKIALIGYGSIFNKKLTSNMKKFQQWLDEPKLFNREADRVFTYFNQTKLIDAEIQEFPSANDGMWTDEGHWDSLYKILNKLNDYEQYVLGSSNFLISAKRILLGKLSLSKEVRRFFSKYNSENPSS
jgi:flavorubredoxin